MRKEKLEELKKYIEELKVVHQEKVDIKSTFLKTEVYYNKLNNNKVIKREKLIKGNNDGSAAIIIPITKEGNVVLVVEPRVFSKRTIGISVPAGYIEKDEEAKLAAIRELKEETGYSFENIIDLGGFYQDMGCSGAYNRIFLAINCEKRYEQNLDDGEYIKYFECALEEAFELIEMNYIEGCNSIIGLTRTKKYLMEN